jgi:hypothetical protein
MNPNWGGEWVLSAACSLRQNAQANPISQVNHSVETSQIQYFQENEDSEESA